MTVQTREEVLSYYPEAKWFAGDPAPVGQRVLIGDNRDPGVVVGDYVRPTERGYHGCPKCDCEREAGLDAPGWWLVAHDRWWVLGTISSVWLAEWFRAHPDAWQAAAMIKSATPPLGRDGKPPENMVTVEYPPNLIPA